MLIREAFHPVRERWNNGHTCHWSPAMTAGGPDPSSAAPAPMPANEARRQATLASLDILDTPPEEAYDDIAVIASQICGTPTAMITLIDGERVWFKAKVGMPASEARRDEAFCTHAVLEPDTLLVVDDARLDLRFDHNPFVTGEAGVRFYAGAPIVLPDCDALGTLCVVDQRPRTLDDAQKRGLRALARQVAQMLAMRKRVSETALLASRQTQLTAEARLGEERGAELLELVLRSGELGMWSLHVPTGHCTLSRREHELLGYDPAVPITGPLNWRDYIHVDDLAEADRALAAHLVDGTTHYACTLRMRHARGHWIRVSSKATVVEKDDCGRPVRIVGTHRDVTREYDAEQQRIAQQAELAQMSAMQERTAELAHVGGWEVDLRANSVLWSDEVYRIHELDRSQTPDLTRAIEYYPGDARTKIQDAIAAAIERDTSWDLELPMVTARGRAIWVRAMGSVSRREAGVATHLVGAFQDITAQKNIELRLADSERRLRGITDNLPVLISELDRAGTYRFANATYSSWLGIDHTALVGTSVRDGVSGTFYEARREQIERALTGERVAFEKQSVLPRGERTLQSTYVPHFDAAGAVNGFYAITVDITEHKANERRLDQLARVDALTGLANRRQFEERVSTTMSPSRSGASQGALMYLDIDRFKSINDTRGHAAGDEVLREFARRLTKRLRSRDLVARHAGDEFVVVLDGSTTPEQARRIADGIVVTMREPMTVDGAPLSITTSIGYTTFGAADASIDVVLSRADAALYRAKQAGRDRASD